MTCFLQYFLFLVVYCGPTEWRFERRRGSSCDRKNTVRHLIQMMSITESNDEENEEIDEENTEDIDVPLEFIDLYNDHELRQTLVDLIHSAADLDILVLCSTLLTGVVGHTGAEKGVDPQS